MTWHLKLIKIKLVSFPKNKLNQGRVMDIKIKFKKMFTAEIGRPIFYKAFYKFILALVPILIWDRFLNVNKYFGIFDTGFFIAGAVYLMLAWMNYLKIDGMKLYGTDLLRRKDKNSGQKKTGSFMDYVQQDIPDYDDLSDEEKMLTKFGANLSIGLIFIIVSLVAITIKGW